MPTAQIPDISQIQNFDTTGFTGFVNGYKDVDWVNNLLYLASATQVKTINLKTFDTHTAVVATSMYGNLFKIGEDGNVYTVFGAGPNCSRINKVAPSALATVVSFFGAAGGSFDFSTDATHWHVPSDIDTIVSNGVHYIVSVSFDAAETTNEVSVVNLDTMAWTGANFNTDEPNPVVTRGLDHGGNGCAYLLGALDGGIALNLYRVEVNNVGVASMTKLFTKAPGDIDATWTTFHKPAGAVVDETDGNIIFRQPSPVDNRIVKINITTGAIMWSVVVTGLPSSVQMNSSLIQSGLYGAIDAGANVDAFFIRTFTGQVIRGTMVGVSADGQFWRDFDGFFCANLTWGGSHPPAAHGTTPVSFSDWGTLFPGAGAPLSNVTLQAQVFG